MKFQIGSIVKSLEGAIYEISGEALNPETNQNMIIYRELRDNKSFVMNEDLFAERVVEIFPVIKKGEWIAFYNNDKTQIWHGRVIDRLDYSKSYYVRKKNGTKLKVLPDSIIGTCTKPTKTKPSEIIKKI